MKLHNSLTGRKKAFVPADPARPTMYVCGPTVYNYPHIGNARSAVVFDLLFRVLKHRFGDVLYARNVTDIEDKIIKAAQDEGVPTDAIVARYTPAYHADMAALNVLQSTVEPFATAHLPQMLAMIAKLLARATPIRPRATSCSMCPRLGTTIDIHGGGQDLRFPHHENEIAQSGCPHH